MTAAFNSELLLNGDGDGVATTGTADSFRCGNFEGHWQVLGPGYRGWPVGLLGIIGVDNCGQRNSQFRPLMRQLITWCLEHQCDLAGISTLNYDLKSHLIKVWGFQTIPGSDDLVRPCYSSKVA